MRSHSPSLWHGFWIATRIFQSIAPATFEPRCTAALKVEIPSSTVHTTSACASIDAGRGETGVCVWVSGV